MRDSWVWCVRGVESSLVGFGEHFKIMEAAVSFVSGKHQIGLMGAVSLLVLLAVVAASVVPSSSEDDVCARQNQSGYLIAFPPPVGFLGSRRGSEWSAAEPSNAYLLVGLDTARARADEVALGYCGGRAGEATATCEAQVKGKLAEVGEGGGEGARGGHGEMSVGELCGFVEHELCSEGQRESAAVVRMPASDYGRLKFVFEPLGDNEGE